MSSAHIVVIGAGLAGMSLADRLSAPAFAGMAVTVLDGKSSFGEDRTWCRFDVGMHPYQAAQIKRWGHALVGLDDQSLEFALGADYQLLSSAAVYRLAQTRIERCAHVEIALDEAVLAMEAAGDKVLVRTGRREIAADLVFDSRPAPDRHGLVQRFSGQWVATAEDAFDPARMTLMHFVSGAHAYPRFVYVLPIDARHALVEDTWLVPAHAHVPDAGEMVRHWLHSRHGVDAYVVEREECGAIALGNRVQGVSLSARHVPIGLRAGHLRASTGFAFDAIQRASDAMAQSLLLALQRKRKISPPRQKHPISRTARWMDRVFLDALSAQPGSGAKWFMAQFKRVPPASLIAFLTDTGGWRDYARVMRSLPPRPFLEAVLRPSVKRIAAGREA